MQTSSKNKRNLPFEHKCTRIKINGRLRINAFPFFLVRWTSSVSNLRISMWRYVKTLFRYLQSHLHLRIGTKRKALRLLVRSPVDHASTPIQAEEQSYSSIYCFIFNQSSPLASPLCKKSALGLITKMKFTFVMGLRNHFHWIKCSATVNLVYVETLKSSIKSVFAG